MLTTKTIDLCLNLFGAVKLDPSSADFEEAALAFIEARKELTAERELLAEPESSGIIPK